MGPVALQFLLAAAVIVAAGTFLSRFADQIAELTGLGRLLVGSVLLAGATSLPELAVDISAARMGFPDVAVGDLMGSSLFNLMILGLLDLLSKSRGQVLSRVSVAHALPATLSIALTALAAMGIVTRSPLGFYGVGVGSLVILLAYVFGVRMVYRNQELAAPIQDNDLILSHGSRPLLKALGGFVMAAAVIVVASPHLADAAGRLAELSGLGGTFVGTTLVALSTSLPELVASLAALRMGAPDLALGNIFGSNTFNMVLLVPVDLAYSQPLFSAVSSTHALTCLATILVTAVVVMGQLYQVQHRVRLIEPDGVLILGLIFASLAMIFYHREPESTASPAEPPRAVAPEAGSPRLGTLAGP